MSRWDHDKSAAERGYGHTWRKLRKLVLARDPICRGCERRASTTVDHVVPKANGGEDRMENLQGLCDTCHEEKTIRERTMEQRLVIVCGAPDPAAVRSSRRTGIGRTPSSICPG